MKSFGVQFRVDRDDLFPSLIASFGMLKKAKAVDDFREVTGFGLTLPEEVRERFYWPTRQESLEWKALRATRPVIVTKPTDSIGATWDLGSLLHAVEDGEYDLLEVIKTSETIAELRIDPHAYPYGGIGAFIALVEAHGMHILGVNEYGKYQSRDEILSS